MTDAPAKTSKASAAAAAAASESTADGKKRFEVKKVSKNLGRSTRRVRY